MNKKAVIFFLFVFLPTFFLYPVETETFVGTWKTIDDKTGKEKSLVEITVNEDGQLKGKIIKLFRGPEEDQNPVCDKCEGDKKNTPLLGMEILWGFSQENKKDANTWRNGNILDPKTGVQYSCNLTIEEPGDKLQVRGYVGFSLIGRTQTWIRVTE